jgi:class 3 adenylate cyclase
MSQTLQEWLGGSKIIALAFTDVIDSTSLGNQLGDERMVEVILKHVAQGRTLIHKFSGFEIKIIGDAFMIAFRTAVEALDFALAFNSATGDDQIMIRVGIHVGPVRVIGNDVFGMMVNYTKRVESQAEKALVILSDEARNHIAYEKAIRHSELKFIPREVKLKGFSEPQKLWVVFDHEAFRKALTAKITVGSVAKKIIFG